MKTDKAPQVAQQLSNIHAPTQIIYADRIVNVGVGASVSRLILAVEVGEKAMSPVAQLVIPTPALFELLEHMATKVTSNDIIKKNIIDSLEAFKEKINKTEELGI